MGEAFHVGSPAAVTFRSYAETAAGWFGREARLVFLPWEEWKTRQDPNDARATWEKLLHSSNVSIDKAQRLLGYEPRYTTYEAVLEAVEWLVQEGIVDPRI